MSADNWRTCPRCEHKAKQEHEKRLEDAKASYGKVDADEFRKLIAEAEKPFEAEEELREDYEQGVREDGTYFVGFYCACQRCGWKWNYEHTCETDALTK